MPGYGTMAARSSTTNLGLTGVPLLIALEMLLYNRGVQTHEEKMGHLSKAYGWIRAYLPALYEKKDAEYTRERIPQIDENGNLVMRSIRDIVNETAIEVDNMYEQYNSTFEGQKSCSQQEKTFLTIMRGVFERLALIITFSGIADKMSNTEEVFF